MDIRAVLALNLRRLRNPRKLSQEALAALADVDRTYVSSIERVQYAISIDVLARLARALNVEEADLLRRPSPPRRNQPEEIVPVLAPARGPKARPRGK